jgi:hypothetical protein
VLTYERLELADECCMTAGGEIGLDPLFEARQTQLLEAGDLVLGEGFVRELGKRGAAPEGERLLQLPLGHERLDAFEIELARPDVELVPGRAREEPISTYGVP